MCGDRFKTWDDDKHTHMWQHANTGTYVRLRRMHQFDFLQWHKACWEFLMASCYAQCRYSSFCCPCVPKSFNLKLCSTSRVWCQQQEKLQRFQIQVLGHIFQNCMTDRSQRSHWWCQLDLESCRWHCFWFCLWVMMKSSPFVHDLSTLPECVRVVLHAFCLCQYIKAC